MRRLWGDGKSATEIAKAIGGTTRSAVLGIIHRRKWAPRGVSVGVTQALQKPPKPARRVEAPPVVPPRPPPRPQPYAGARNIDILALNLSTCRYVTDDTKWAALYCGCEVSEGSVYCAHHKSLCRTTTRVLAISLPKAVRKGRDEAW